MQLREERTEITEFGMRMVDAGLTTGTGGNLSRIHREKGRVAITPSGIAYDRMTGADVVVTDLTGTPVEGRHTPSSELGFHLALYRRRPDIGAVIHTHSPYATTLACLGWEIPAVHYLVGFAGLRVPVAPYATFGTDALARSVAETIGDNNAVLLANHGLAAVGRSLPDAFVVAEEIEFVARIYFQTRCAGEPNILSDEQMGDVLEKFKTYGQKTLT